TLNVGTAILDTIGNRLVVPYTQTFTIGGEQPPAGDGSGFISGEIYDATTGRPLAGATVTVEIPNAAFSTNTDARGRYLVRLPEGAHTIRAWMNGYTSVWRQIVVPSGAGVVPIDIRLTRRNDTKTHGGETPLTRPVELTTSSTATVTAVGAQALTGLLPLGWSPLTSAEVVAEGALTGTQLTFNVPAAEVTAATQNLAAVRYDEVRDEWNVLESVVNITDGKVTLPISTAGAYALVYADKAPGLAVPPLAQTGAVLAGVPAPEEQAPLVSRAFTLDPPIVLPNGRTVAALQIEGAASATFPSGTAVQAYIDEELRLADGSRLLDPPFATDLLLYRNLAGSVGNADFHLAPSPRAAQVILEVGFDHIRVVPYPGRLDRGTLVGSEGGRIPGDDRIAIDIPAGATPEPLRATALSLTQQDLDAVGTISGFQIVGGFTLTLQRATQPTPQDVDGDGQPDVDPTPVQLFKPARATFTLSTQHSALSTQFVLVELLDQTPYGKMVRLAAQIERPSPARATTTSIDRSVLPLDGIAHEGRYLLLAADAPIAFATGVLRLGGTLLPNARVTANALGVADLTRTDGIYNIPVLAVPAAPFTLTPRHTETGDGAAYTHASAPAPDAIVRVDLALVPQPPRLVAVTVFAGQPPALVTLGASSVTDVSPSTGVRATFTPAIDPASVTDDSIKVVDASTGIAVAGKSTADGTLAVNWALTPGTTLESGHRYIVLVSPRIRAPNGAELGNATTYGFTTAEVVLNTEVRAERISITIPDANGVSRVTGGTGALPANWQALVVRRRRDFITRYQATAAADGSFTFLVGNGGDRADRVTMSDLIDLRVVNNAGNLAAIIPLTPFVTEDRRGFVVPAGEAARFVTADNIVIDVPAGTFDEATMVTAKVVAKTFFDDVPALDQELNFAASVKLEFEGTANNAIEVEIPVPAGMDTANRNFILALKGQSIRGPRLMAVDTLRIADGKFTTTLDPAPGARRVSVQTYAGGVRTNQTLTGNDLKDYLLRVERSGVYMVLDIKVPVGGAVGWAAMEGLQASYDIFWNVLASMYAAHYYVVERGRIAIPVLQGVPFTVVGVDASTGMQAFTKDYDPIPLGEPGVSTLPPPQNNQGGPYPVFGTPFRVDLIDLNVADVNIRTARNFVLRLSNGQVSVVPSTEPLPADTQVQVLNVTNGESIAGTAGGGMSLSASRGDRVVLLVAERQVDPSSLLTIVFNEPIFIDGVDEDPIHEFLKTKIRLEKGTLPNGATSPVYTDISDMARFTADSGGRRITITLPSSLQRDAFYRAVLDQTIADRGGQNGTAGLTLGQGAVVVNGNATGIGGGSDLRLEFRTRKPGGTIGSFELQNGAARDLALNGNVLLVAASNGGVVAYDVSDPASLNGVPTPIAVAPANNNEVWALASDHHGRIYTTNLGPVAGAVRSYRLEDFTSGGTCCEIYGSALTNWRVGYSSSLGLFSNTMLSDRPESFPRKIQLAVQDDKTEYKGREAFVNQAGASLGTVYANGMAKMSVSFGLDGNNPYRIQRITVENQTLDMRWSADATETQAATINNILAGPNDTIQVIKNRTTYGFISHLGYGIGMYDLNAIESNRQPNPPSGFKRAAEQVALTRGLNVPSCFPNSIVPPAPAIQEIWLSSDTAIRPEPGTSNLLAYAPEPYRGLLDLRFKPPTGPNSGTSINNSSACDQRGPNGLIIRAVDPADDHPRITALKAAYNGVAGRDPYPHFFSVANYTWRLEEIDNKKGVRRSIANQAVQRDYVLLAAGDFGLLVVEVGGDPSPTQNIPYWPLNPIHLADIIWVPGGAMGVRTIPRTNFAVVTSRYGRVHLVDLSRIDERFDETGTAIGFDELFPTALAAINGTPQYPDGVGAPDPRIVWTSEPNTAQGIMAPVVDPDTGMMYAGHMVSRTMKAVAAIDPRVQMKVDLGKETLSEVGGVVPHGIDPPKKILDAINALDPCNGSNSRCKENASLGTFRLEVSLPGSIVQLLTASNNEIHVAVESERVFNAVTEQTPAGLPRSHLRRFRRNGSAEDPSRAATTFRLQRMIPEEDAALVQALRYQKGFNKFISPWIVAIADPRASAQFLWQNNPSSEEKADAGCHSCDRPQYLEGHTEADGVFELWTNGRIIAVRPEINANGNNIFAGTPYAYLGEE
ncbi:MAG: carboxypeptidase regulatory-like domain-containing protein, partial [Thermoanaerobaculia bacterium]